MPNKPVPIESIPEVVAYEEAKEMVDIFREQHKKVFASYDMLIDSLSQKRDAADKAVRSRQVSCGDWDWYQTQTKINVDLLLNTLGVERFLEIGGTSTTETIYKIDEDTIKAAATRKFITETLSKEAIVKIPKYHAPKD